MKNKLGLPESIFDAMISNYQNTMRELYKYGIISIGELTDVTEYKIAVPSSSNIDGKIYNADETAQLAKAILSEWAKTCGIEEIHVLYKITDREWTDELSKKTLEEFNDTVEENPYFPFGKEMFEDAD